MRFRLVGFLLHCLGGLNGLLLDGGRGVLVADEAEGEGTAALGHGAQVDGIDVYKRQVGGWDGLPLPDGGRGSLLRPSGRESHHCGTLLTCTRGRCYRPRVFIRLRHIESVSPLGSGPKLVSRRTLDVYKRQVKYSMLSAREVLPFPPWPSRQTLRMFCTE